MRIKTSHTGMYTAERIGRYMRSINELRTRHLAKNREVYTFFIGTSFKTAVISNKNWIQCQIYIIMVIKFTISTVINKFRKKVIIRRRNFIVTNQNKD